MDEYSREAAISKGARVFGETFSVKNTSLSTLPSHGIYISHNALGPRAILLLYDHLGTSLPLIAYISQSATEREDMQFYNRALGFAKEAIAGPLERRQDISDSELIPLSPLVLGTHSSSPATG